MLKNYSQLQDSVIKLYSSVYNLGEDDSLIIIRSKVIQLRSELTLFLAEIREIFHIPPVAYNFFGVPKPHSFQVLVKFNDKFQELESKYKEFDKIKNAQLNLFENVTP